RRRIARRLAVLPEVQSLLSGLATLATDLDA
ncbi:unnamed protein product, partial [Mycobacterium sp. PO1]